MMETTTFTVENTFHGTTATIILPAVGRKLTRDERDTVLNALCGMDDCNCGGVMPGDNQDCVWDMKPGASLPVVRPLK